MKLFGSQVLTLLNATQSKIHHTTEPAGPSHWAGIPNMAFLLYLGVPAEQANTNYILRTRTSQLRARWCFIMSAYDLRERLLCHLPACPWSCLQFCKKESLASFPRLPRAQSAAGTVFMEPTCKQHILNVIPEGGRLFSQPC